MSRPGGGQRQVAVKVLKPDLRRVDEAVRRLRDEGRMLAVLDHPSIVRALEMTLIGGRVALVTEYIAGVDLARCCREPRLLPHRAVVQAVGEIASALDTAWNTPSPETGKPLELIHRDIKPANIRVGATGEIKILDFGIARTTEMYRHAKTAQGALPFTRGTAAPEAFTKGFQGSASDVYALGITFFRMLAGQHFYAGLELSDQVNTVCLDERYTPYLRRRLELLDVKVPAPVIDLIRAMLAYEASDRPDAASVAATASALVSGMTGPHLREWATSMDFPAPAGVEGGSLTGETLFEDPVEGDSAASIKRNPSLVLDDGGGHTDVGPDGDELPVAPPPPRVSSVAPASPRQTAPPPVPRSLRSNSIKPYTAPTALGALVESEVARATPEPSGVRRARTLPPRSMDTRSISQRRFHPRLRRRRPGRWRWATCRSGASTVTLPSWVPSTSPHRRVGAGSCRWCCWWWWARC